MASPSTSRTIAAASVSLGSASHGREEERSSPPRDSFMVLPPELRNMVYKHIFDTLDFAVLGQPKSHYAAITRVNKEIRDESFDLFYARPRFEFFVPTCFSGPHSPDLCTRRLVVREFCLSIGYFNCIGQTSGLRLIATLLVSESFKEMFLTNLDFGNLVERYNRDGVDLVYLMRCDWAEWRLEKLIGTFGKSGNKRIKSEFNHKFRAFLASLYLALVEMHTFE